MNILEHEAISISRFCFSYYWQSRLLSSSVFFCIIFLANPSTWTFMILIVSVLQSTQKCALFRLFFMYFSGLSVGSLFQSRNVTFNSENVFYYLLNNFYLTKSIYCYTKLPLFAYWTPIENSSFLFSVVPLLESVIFILWDLFNVFSKSSTNVF